MKVFRIVNDNNYNVLLYCFKYIKQRGRVFSKFALCPQLCNVEYCSNVKARYSSNLTQKDQRGGEWALGWSDVSKTLPPIRYSFTVKVQCRKIIEFGQRAWRTHGKVFIFKKSQRIKNEYFFQKFANIFLLRQRAIAKQKI